MQEADSEANLASILIQNQDGGYRLLGADSSELSSRNENGASVLQATFSLVNIYMGLALLSMPYAMREAGWVGIVALALSVGLLCLSAKLLTAGFRVIPFSEPQSYPNLGTKALGISGKYVVAGFTVLEFFGSSCIMLVVIWKELAALLPEHDILHQSSFHFAIWVSMIAMVPMLFLPSFKKLSCFNLLGCISTLLVSCTILGVMLSDISRTKMPIQPPAGHDVIRPGLFKAIGIFVLSVSGHSSLPVLRASMARPQDFGKVLNFGFFTMLLLYGIVAVCGYFYFGKFSHELLTEDLALNSPVSGVSLLIPGFTIDKLVSAFILVNIFTTYPNLLLVIQDTVWKVSQWASLESPEPPYFLGLLMRVSLFIVGSCLSLLAYKVLGNIMSLTGGFCSISCSVLLPIIIYVLLFQRRSGKLVLGSLYVLLAFGLFLLTLTTYQNIVEIVHKSTTENTLSLVSRLSGDYLGCGKQTIMPFLANFMCPVQ